MIELPILQFWLGVLTLAIAGVGATVGAVWTISNKIHDIETTTDRKILEAVEAQDRKLKEAQAEGDSKRQTIYRRFDEYKNHLETNFVRREMCALMHNETAKAVTRIADEMSDIKKQLSEVKAIVITLQAERNTAS